MKGSVTSQQRFRTFKLLEITPMQRDVHKRGVQWIVQKYVCALGTTFECRCYGMCVSKSWLLLQQSNILTSSSNFTVVKNTGRLFPM